MDYVVIIDEKDQQTGTAEKLETHQRGLLHRAFSVFVFNDDHELLLQQRASNKYHSGGLWTNSCCSHPAPGELTEDAAHRRLMEEMGFDCELRYLQPFRYQANVGNNLIENELDHLYEGHYNGPINPNPDEVKTYQFLSLTEIISWIEREPGAFTEWFKMIMKAYDFGSLFVK